MFIKDTTFNRWCKNEHKMGSLIIGKIGENYIITGGIANILIHEKSITNKQKAIMITYSGELAKEGEVWNTKDKNYKFNEWERLFNNAKEEELYKSWMILEPKVDSGIKLRIYMNEKEEPICAINEGVAEEISDAALQPNEGSVIGPVLTGNLVVWRNESMILSTYTSEREDVKKLMNRMKAFVLAEKEALIQQD